MQPTRRIHTDVLAVAMLAGIVFLIAALATYDPHDPVTTLSGIEGVFQPDCIAYPANERVQNACGPVGAWLSAALFQILGWGTVLLVLGLIAVDVSLLRSGPSEAPWLKTSGWLLTMLGATTLASHFIPWTAWTPVVGGGGYLGALLHGTLSTYLATGGGLIVSAALTLVGLLMWTEYLVVSAGRLMFAPAAVAAASVLPWGLLRRALVWFNGQRQATRVPRRASTSENIDGSDLPRTIRVKSRHSQSEPDRDESAAESDDTIQPAIIPMVTKPSLLDDAEEDAELGSEEDELLNAGGELDETGPSESPMPAVRAEPAVTARSHRLPTARDQVIAELNQADFAESAAEYELPSIELLLRGDAVSFDTQKKEALQKAEMLERTCAEFGYSVRVVEIETGPVISQYEIQLEAGLRLQKIAALADDLAIALRVPSVRIVAPIPGKNTVGVEVPNETRQLVRLREVIEQSETKARKMKIPLFLGKDAVGAPLIVDLASLPHLLIAGRTGTGKSVCLNAIITSILMTRRPDEVRLLLVDPKMVELSGYGRLPHLMHPVVTDMRKAEAILAWAVDKMEERYALLARAGVRHIASFNQLGPEEIYERLQAETEEERANVPTNLPFIVIVADEMADLMMTAGKEAEQHIIRLAQKSRAVGIHLILATQKPTVDVITGLIKSNLPARIAFQVASKVDSRVVLDAMGADRLLGNGDMLFLWPGTSTLIRGQGTYLSDDEIEAVTESVSTSEQQFVNELLQIKVAPRDGEERTGPRPPHRDDLYESAVEVVIREGRGSVSLLQRALGIGYGRAARLIDFMEEDGVVGTYNGSKSRDVIMTMEQWRDVQDGGEAPEIAPEPRAVTVAFPRGRITKLSAAESRSALVSNPAPPAAADDAEQLAPHAEGFEDDFEYEDVSEEEDEPDDVEDDET